MIVNGKLLWSDYVETMQHFDMLQQILVTHGCCIMIRIMLDVVL